jgi:hypothetical protein
MLDGGPGAEPAGRLDAWLVTGERGLRPYAGSFQRGELRVDARPVVHTSYPTFGYRIQAPEGTLVWAPEFLEFPGWARGEQPVFGEFARDGQVFRVTGRR